MSTVPSESIPVPEPTESQVERVEEEEEEVDTKHARKRTFTVNESSVELKGGRYVSKSATQAAQKASKQLFRKVGEDTNEITFVLRELKPRVKGVKPTPPKLMKYVTKRELRAEPLKVMLDGNEVWIRYNFKVIPLGRVGKDGIARKEVAEPVTE